MAMRPRYLVLVGFAIASSYAAFLSCRDGSGNRALYETITCFLLNGVILGTVWYAACRLIVRRRSIEPIWVPLAGGAAVATAGFLLFWLYLAAPLAGKLGSGALALASVSVLAVHGRRHRTAPDDTSPDSAADATAVRTVATLMVAIGLFYVAVLHLFPTSAGFYDLAANRLREGLPSDNRLPHDTIEPMYRGERRKDLGAGWLTSDRPPLQAGWQLISYPLSSVLRTDPHALTGTSAMWLQLLWIPACYGLLRRLGLASGRAAMWIVLLSMTGFFAQNTIFTWPKLSAGAFGCGAFASWMLPSERHRWPDRHLIGGVFAGLAWMSHGGIAFSFLALAPWIAWRILHGEIRPWLIAGGAFLVFALPWAGFQKFYNPPGDRLLKIHLAGEAVPDARGIWTALHDAYHAKTWTEIAANKYANFRILALGTWPALFDFSPRTSVLRRNDEFFCTFRALTWWLFAPVALSCALGLRRWRARAEPRSAGAPEQGSHADVILLIWTAATLVIWCLLMFGPYQAAIHQGSYATMLCLFAVASAWLERAGRWWFVPVGVLQLATFGSTWAGPNAQVHGRPAGWPFVLAASIALGLLIAQHASAPPEYPRGCRDGTRG